MAELNLFPTSDIDFEVIQNGQIVAMRFRSAGGEPAYVAVPVDLLKKAYTHIPTVLGMARDARAKAGIAEELPQTPALPPPLHDLTRIEFGLLGAEPEKVCLLFELNRAMTLATRVDRTWIGNALRFLQEKLVETESRKA